MSSRQDELFFSLYHSLISARKERRSSDSLFSSPFASQFSGLHDRYSLSRSLIGFPPVVAIVSTLILPDQGSIEEELSKVQDLLSCRISKLLEIVPFLSARVSDHQSMEPKWVKSERILTSKDILHLNLIENQVFGYEEICSKQLDVGIKTLMPQKGPLWRVDIHHRLDSSLIYIGLSVNHTLADGKGSFNLYQLLISPPFDLSRDLTQTQVEMIRGVKVFPDPSDVCFMKSDWETPLTKTSESISASSKKDQDSVAESECWPYTIEKRIKDCQSDLILIQLKRKGILKDLKDNCIKFGSIKTFHAAIHSSIIVGILSLNLLENPSRIKGDGYGFQSSSRDKIGLKSATPINIRKGEFGLIVGNFVGVSEWKGQFDPSSLFWKVTKEHDKELNSVEGRKKALSFIGMLDNVSLIISLARRTSLDLKFT